MHVRSPSASEAELRADQAVDLAAVGAALGLAHDGADDGADRLAVAGADLLGGLGVGLDRGGDDRLQLAVVGAICARPSRSTIAAGSPPSATSAARTVLPLPWEIFFASTSVDQLGERAGVDLGAGGARPRLGLAQRRGELAGDPVGDRLRLGGAAAASAARSSSAVSGSVGQERAASAARPSPT